MKQLITLLAVAGSVVTCFAGDPEKDKWWYFPKTNAVPLNALELNLDFEQEPRGLQSRNVLILQYKNVGKSTIDAWHAQAVFQVGAVHLAPPERDKYPTTRASLFHWTVRRHATCRTAGHQAW